MNLRQLIEDTQLSVYTYKFPDTEEFRKNVNLILVASGLSSIDEHDKIESIDISDGWVSIRTSYYSRSCECSSDYKFPEYLLDEDDYVKESKLWGINREIQENHEKLVRLEKDIAHIKNSLSSLLTRKFKLHGKSS